MKRRWSADGRTPAIVFPLVVLLGALLVSAPTARGTLRFWLRLPALRASFLDPAELEAAFERARRGAPAEAREAFALRLASKTLTGALMHRVEPERLQATVAEAVGMLSRSQVGRLQQAAARLWLLEQGGEPLGNWWPASRVFFEGMERAKLRHYQAALARRWSGPYESLGLGPGTARGLAEELVGHPHGPFLQFFVQRLRRVIGEREQAGDAAAATSCRKVLYHLLKQWVLEPGPAGLRLLAADLLAESLEEDAAGTAASDAKALGRDLRAWRSAYRQAAGRRPIAILDPYRKPALAPLAHEGLLRRVALTGWLASGTVAVAIVGLGLGWLTLGGARAGIGQRGMLLLYSGCVAFVAVATGLVHVNAWPEAVREEMRGLADAARELAQSSFGPESPGGGRPGDLSILGYAWRLPCLAAGLTLGLVLLGGLLQRARATQKPGLLASLGTVALGTWLILAVVLSGSVIAGEGARREYERATQAAHEDPIAAIAGPDAECLLDGLRRWEP